MGLAHVWLSWGEDFFCHAEQRGFFATLVIVILNFLDFQHAKAVRYCSFAREFKLLLLTGRDRMNFLFSVG